MSQILFTQADWQLFTNINTLPQQAGVSKHLLPKLVAKELTDNALDTGAKVEISQYSEELFRDTIIVRDFGEGIAGSNEEIADLFSLKRPLTSSKRFRLPLRGALGNGLRVVVATVYCTNGELTVSTKGRTLQIVPQDDGTSAYKFLGDFEGEGTEIKVSIPDNFFGEGLLDWANLALQINQGENYQGKTNPYWYDSDSFYSLLQATPDKVLLQDFLVFFEGMNLSKAKKILPKIFNSPSNKKSLEGDFIHQISREEADLILDKLRNLCKNPNPQKLGSVGKLQGFSAYHKEFISFDLKTTKGKSDAKIPAVVEAFGKLDDKNASQFFVNKTPITGTVDLSYFEKRLSIYGCGLSKTIETPKLKANPQIWLNVTTPYMPIVSNGKEPDLSVLSEAIENALRKVANQLKKNELSEHNQEGNFNLDKSPSQKQVVIENLEAAMNKASGQGQYRYSLRQLYYALRPFVMEQTGKELKYANFNTIITDYEYELGSDLKGIYRDERGTLLHPHTHEEIKLGTKSIEKYRRPIFNFNKILYSEKEGFFEILKDVGFCEKHDCALLTSKGFASRAARDVIDLLAETEEELIFFCIHDADISGTLIYQALQGATKARPERKVKIINIGIEPWEGLSMNLEVESLEKRSSKNPAGYVLEYDRDLTNKKPFNFAKYERWADWQEWLKSFRIELNAMDTPTFIAWLDKKISEYDHLGKVVPHENYLKKEAENTLQASLQQKIKEEILRKIDIDKLVFEKFESTYPELIAQLKDLTFEDKVRNDLSEEPQQSWQKSFYEILSQIIHQIKID